MIPQPARSTLFPYTTLFRSGRRIRRSNRGRDKMRRRRIQMQTVPGNVGTGAIKSARACEFHLAQNHLISSERDRKSTRLNSSHLGISYAVFCLKKKNKIRLI